MNSKSFRTGALAAAAFVAALIFAASVSAQTMFYTEVVKDGRIYVFANGQRYDTFEKGGRTEVGPAITRLGYGPNGETVVFDSEDAINLYNYKHDKPGEYFPKAKEAPKSNYPAGKISGLMFGDYYWFEEWHQNQISATNTNSVKDQQGFWMRRIYFTYDMAFSEKFTTRFRLEANSNGQFAGGNLGPYVKDAFLKWTYYEKQQLTLGIHPSLTFDWLEGYWGLRHIEKTPADLYRIDSSRDFGVTLSGPVTQVRGLNYGAQFGNDSGNGSETDKFKIGRAEVRFERDPGIALEGFFSYAKRPNGQNRTTAQGFAGYKYKTLRAGAQYLWQERRSNTTAPDLNLHIVSGFAVYDVRPKKADLFLRYDNVRGDLGGTDTGLPGADGIDYLILSPKTKFMTWIVGGEWYLHPSIRLSPNVELVQYADDPDPVNFPGRDMDRIWRLTYYWTF